MRVVLGFVDNASFNGSYNRNPYNFRHYDISQVRIMIDGQQQHVRPFEPNFANNWYIREYMSLFEGVSKIGKDEGVDITRDDYAHGYTLFCWDLSPDQCDGGGGHMNLARDGTVRLDVRFNTALAGTINAVVYGEFENLIEIDKHKQVLIDYTS